MSEILDYDEEYDEYDLENIPITVDENEESENIYDDSSDNSTFNVDEEVIQKFPAKKQVASIQRRNKIPCLITNQTISQRLYSKHIELLEARENGIPIGIKTGFPRTDKYLGGYLSPGLHVLHASPGAGKTAWALQVGQQNESVTLYLTTEMSVGTLYQRHMARINNKFLSTYTTKDADMIPLKEFLNDMKFAGSMLDRFCWVDTFENSFNPSELSSVVQGLKDDYETDHVLVVVDSLHAWATKTLGHKQEYDRLQTIISTLNDVSNKSRCPLLLICHRSREKQSQGGLTAAKGNGDIEFYANTIMDLHNEEGYEETGKIEVPRYLRIHKNRSGEAPVSIPYTFHKAYQRFEEITEAEVKQKTNTSKGFRRN